MPKVPANKVHRAAVSPENNKPAPSKVVVNSTKKSNSSFDGNTIKPQGAPTNQNLVRLSSALVSYNYFLDKLKIKTNELISKSTTSTVFYDKRYIDAGHAAKQLIKQLEDAGTLFFKNKDEYPTAT
jgi:hypothetical protein